MGFSGGGSNVLLPHKHDGRVSQDGGELDFNNITQSNSSSGQVFYSNGTALQQLAIGAPATVLTVSGANLPAWTAAGGAVNTNRLQINGATNNSTYTNTALGDLTGTTSVALSNQAGGSAFVAYSYTCECSSSSNISIAIEIGGTDMNFHKDQSASANALRIMAGCTASVETNGDTVQQRLATNAGTLTIYNDASVNGVTLTDIIEVY